jgi:oligosaccharide reducing-end xylanase
MPNAFKTGIYTNYFAELGYTQEQIDKRLNDAFETIFFGPEDQRIYHKTNGGMGYMVDTGNNDARTEGMSYGMMIAVQFDRKDIFDRLWKWSKTYMWQESGPNRGYFAWSCKLDGTRNAEGPAPDGEEFYAMALLFASNRWGDGDGIFNYSAEAKAILHECVHKGEDGVGDPMFDPETRLIRFVPNCDFSDPSYHLPHFYELFALWGNPEDARFFKEAAAASRAYLHKACHPVTGLNPEYANYDGTPRNQRNHHNFFSDAYRTIANIGLDYEWFEADPWQIQCADNLQKFFCETVKGKEDLVYAIDGTPVTDPAQLVTSPPEGVHDRVLHPVALIATNAQASLAARGKYRAECAQKLWDLPIRTGPRRYYDNLLYMFALQALSGNYRIYKPK